MKKEDFCVIFDWFSFTAKGYQLPEFLDFCGLSDVDFVDCQGHYGYKRAKFFNGIWVLYDGSDGTESPFAEDMGICLELTGQGCREFETLENHDLETFINFVAVCEQNDEKNFNITRLDVAFDDIDKEGNGLLDIDLIDSIARADEGGAFVSKFRQCGGSWVRKLSASKEDDYEHPAKTVYFGSPKSEVRFRIYDKAQERGGLGYHWVRFEMQLRRERAFNFLVSELVLGERFCGVINNYLRFVEPSATDSNKWRWHTFQKYVNFPSTARTSSYMPYIIDNNRFVSSGGSEEMYFLFFFQDDTNEYISEFQFRFYFEVKTNYDDSGSVTSVEKYPRLQMWSNIDGSISEPIEFLDSTVDCSDYKYFSIDIYNSSSAFRIVGYKTFTDFLNATNKNSWSKSYFTGNYDKLYLPDFSGSTQYSTQISGISSHTFMGSYDYHTSKSCKYNDNCDIGLYVSSTPIDFTYRDIDTTKIPANQIITINGDTIYNYTITNPETGDSSKFGDYITNNYTYITNNYGGSESGGSSGSGVSGNVTVGGAIDVGGSVGVDITVSVPDININVNGNGVAGGSGSSIANPDDFTSADEVDLTKYYDEAVEQSSGFQKFLKDFFGFLPAELLGVILFAVAMAIVCRVFGR